MDTPDAMKTITKHSIEFRKLKYYLYITGTWKIQIGGIRWIYQFRFKQTLGMNCMEMELLNGQN